VRDCKPTGGEKKKGDSWRERTLKRRASLPRLERGEEEDSLSLLTCEAGNLKRETGAPTS